MNETQIATAMEQLEAFLNSEMANPSNLSEGPFAEKARAFLNRIGFRSIEEVGPYMIEFDLFLEGKDAGGNDVKVLCVSHDLIRILPRAAAQEIVCEGINTFVDKYGTEPRLTSTFRVKKMDL